VESLLNTAFSIAVDASSFRAQPATQAPSSSSNQCDQQQAEKKSTLDQALVGPTSQVRGVNWDKSCNNRWVFSSGGKKKYFGIASIGIEAARLQYENFAKAMSNANKKLKQALMAGTVAPTAAA
jgi:hypothetical protein